MKLSKLSLKSHSRKMLNWNVQVFSPLPWPGRINKSETLSKICSLLSVQCLEQRNWCHFLHPVLAVRKTDKIFQYFQGSEFNPKYKWAESWSGNLFPFSGKNVFETTPKEYFLMHIDIIQNKTGYFFVGFVWIKKYQVKRKIAVSVSKIFTRFR